MRVGRRRSLVLAVPLIVVTSLASAAQPAPAIDAGNPPSRPRIGLVLGGGGARGAAHVGVIEVLEKLRVPIDCVVGTSMGGLVAGAYASGLGPDTMRDKLAGANWDDLFQDDPPFYQQNFRKKVLDARYLPASETGVGRNGVHYQTGVRTGQKIKLFFNQLVGDHLGERSIESLPLPLSIIATDIVRGERVVFRDGSLTGAMRASMSVPGLMSPVQIGNRKLVDGGLVDNLPIGEARSRCQADKLIVVNVGSPLLRDEEISGLLSVSVQMVNILTEQNVARSLATLKPTDIYIEPHLQGISAGDFKRTDETADRGAQATEAVADRLRTLSVDERTYADWKAKMQTNRGTSLRVDAIEINGLKRVNPAVVERHMYTRPGDIIDAGKVNADLLRTYGDGYYEHVDYSLVTLRDRNILRITPVEKNWGPDYIRYGLHFGSNFVGNASYGLRAAYHKTWLNSLGGEFLAFGQIGSKIELGADYYQPLDERQQYFFETSLRRGSKQRSIYQDNNKLADYRVIDTDFRLGGGINIGLLGQARLGWQEGWWESKRDTGLPFLPEESKHDNGWFASLDLDQTDRLYFPTSGWSTNTRYFESSNNAYSKLDLGVNAYWSVGDWVLGGRFSYQGSPRGQLPVNDAASLGGMLRMSAFATGQLNGDDIRYGHLRAERIVGRLPLGLRGDMRLGMALETAKIGRPYTETNLRGWINSGAIYLGGETPLGPVYVGYGYSNAGSVGGYSNFYLFLGTP
ncbi:MAG TPA: patatin-like phospholipase family protein [Accumulibacter sp.]|nr:patatin-like phospholipase family protein [Accumulibacter sp.]HQC79182.1 patatin-like phospholipase family protein [Accumulibacter sp.]